MSLTKYIAFVSLLLGAAFACLASGTEAELQKLPTISISAAINNESAGELVFQAILSQVSSNEIAVHYETIQDAEDNAIAGKDYEAASGDLIFALGETNLTRTITVRIYDNQYSEVDRSFTVLLSNAQNGELANAKGTGMILDDDPYPQVLIDNPSSVLSEEKSSVTFNVSLTQISGQTVILEYLTLDDTALAGRDYAATNGMLVFRPGETNGIIVVPVLDSAAQTIRNFTLLLTNAVYADITVGGGMGSIAPRPLREIQISDIRVNEGDFGSSNALLTVTLSRPSSEAASVDYYTVNGTATAGIDYEERHETLVFIPGVTNATILIPILGNTLNEPDKTFQVQLTNASNGAIVIGRATVVIANDDFERTLLIAPTVASEGNEGFTSMVFQVRLSAPSSIETTVNYATRNGTAIAGSDYLATNGILTLPAGQTQQAIVVAVRGNLMPEHDKTFYVELSDPMHARILAGQESATGIILNDDTYPLLTIGDGIVKEPLSGSTNVSLVVRLSSPSGETVTVEYSTVNGTATEGLDYTGQTNVLTFPPGTTTVSLPIQILANGKADGDKMFFVQLTNASKAILEDALGQATILQSSVITNTGAAEKSVLSVSRSASGEPELRLSGSTGGSYWIQESSNLQEWLDITNAIHDGWSMPLTTSQPSKSQHLFYRALTR